MILLKNVITCYISLFITFSFLLSQNYNPEELEQLIERITVEENVNIPLDEIEYYILQPINLRTCSEMEVAEIPFISFDLAIKIKNLIIKYPQIHFSQIKDSLVLSDDIFYLLTLTTFLTKQMEREEEKKFKLDTRARYQPLINKIKGFEDGKYLGTPFDSYLRLRANYDDVKTGFLMTKDIGEKKLTEFIAGYLKFKVLGLDVTLGDFTIHSGMGNILWSQYSFGKGSETIYPAVAFKSSTNNYLSSTEAEFFRGIAADFSFELSKSINLKNSVWMSLRKLSGTLDDSNDTITAIYNSGLFRTETEIQKKNNLNEMIIGFKTEINSADFIIGLTGFFFQFDKYINSQSRSVFNGKSGYLGSLYYMANLGGTNFTGELCIDKNNNPAFRSSFSKSYQNIELALNVRYFHQDFRSPFGFNFGDSPEVNNESGIYTGLKWKISNRVLISGYFDFYKTLAKTFFIPFIKNGQDLFIQTDWKTDPFSNLRIRFDYNSKTDNLTDDKGNRNFIQKAKYYSRIEYHRYIISSFQIKLRTDFNFVDLSNIKSEETGFASSLEISYKPEKNLLLQTRITKFDTDSFESAIWQFESPVPGYMFSQALYGNGWRAYFGIRYNIYDFIYFAIRFSITSKNNVNNIGSGLNQIEDNNDKKLCVQLEIKFL